MTILTEDQKKQFKPSISVFVLLSLCPFSSHGWIPSIYLSICQPVVYFIYHDIDNDVVPMLLKKGEATIHHGHTGE